METNERCFFSLQPQVELKTGKIIGAEALARWENCGGEIIAPSDFLPVFEAENGLPAVDWHICRGVADFLRAEKTAGRNTVPIAVNLSRQNALYKNFSARVHEMLREAGISADEIVFELTEDLPLYDVFGAQKMLRNLKSYGYRLSVDDFGSGYSSLETLLTFDMDEIKLDKSLLGGSHYMRRRSRALIEGVVSIAEKLGMTVLCEGVETKEQVEYLAQVGCDAVQGYYFARPMPPEEFSALLREQDGGFAKDWLCQN